MTLNPTEKRARDEPMRQVSVQIINKLGLHLRPASQLVKLANEFDKCEIFISKNDQKVNAKSIMGVIMLAAEQGSELVIEAIGKKSDQAIASLEQLIASGFGEE